MILWNFISHTHPCRIYQVYTHDLFGSYWSTVCITQQVVLPPFSTEDTSPFCRTEFVYIYISLHPPCLRHISLPQNSYYYINSTTVHQSMLLPLVFYKQCAVASSVNQRGSSSIVNSLLHDECISPEATSRFSAEDPSPRILLVDRSTINNKMRFLVCSFQSKSIH